ncbi:MAG: hypothetical protein ACREL9_09980 [Gemmatimonadales bacterium]
MSPGRRRFVATAAVLLVVAAVPTAAQTVRGTIVSWVSPPPPFELATGQTLELRVEMPEVPFVLPVIAVERNNPCRNGPEGGVETAALWEAAQKTLAVDGDKPRPLPVLRRL